MTRALSNVSTRDKRLAEAHRGVQSLARRPATPSANAAGVALYEIKVFEDPNLLVAGDGRFYWPIPEELDGAEIVYADAGVTTPSSSGNVQIQIAHQSGGVGSWTDVLSTKITVAAGDKGATPGVVVGGAYGPLSAVGTAKDWLRIDVDAVGVDTTGLAVMVGLIPSPLGSVAVQGAKGDPGGVTSWQGQWTTSTAYTTGQAVSNNGSSYVARVNHTSGATSEPGVGASWQTYWMLLSAGQPYSAFEMLLSGNGFVVDVGVKGWMTVPFNCTIVEATLLADLYGDLVVDIWKDVYGSYPPTNADSITAAAPPTLSAAIQTTDTTLSGWTTALATGDVLAFNVDSCALIKRATLSLRVQRI